jgi:hypothetical protein
VTLGKETPNIFVLRRLALDILSIPYMRKLVVERSSYLATTAQYKDNNKETLHCNLYVVLILLCMLSFPLTIFPHPYIGFVPVYSVPHSAGAIPDKCKHLFLG